MSDPPGLLIFDCDGVLVDTEPISNRILAGAISDAGLPMDADTAARAFESMRLDDIQAEVEGQLGRSLPADWLPAFEAKRVAAFREGVEAIPGIADALGALHAAQVPICVASQASREKMELTLGLTGLLTHFDLDALFSSQMVVHGKPHPELFLFAARSMDIEPARCVVVEDGAPGSRGGRAAGMRVLGYAPEGRGAHLAAEGAEIFTSMAELPDLLGITSGQSD